MSSTLHLRFAAPIPAGPGIRYMTHVHASTAGNGGNRMRANPYPLTPRAELAVAAVTHATVVACTLVFIEGLATQHTVLEIEPS
jgi:hypothetical protein